MPSEIVVPLAAFVVGCLLRLIVRRRAPDSAGLHEAARRFIDARIDQHIDRLAAQHRRVSPGDPDEIPPRFANAIQTFIAEALLRDVMVATADEEVAGAVRELVISDLTPTERRTGTTGSGLDGAV